MLMKVLLSALLLQATAMAEECPEEEIVTQRITDVQGAGGNWSVVYYWNKEVALSAMKGPECFAAALAPVTVEEVQARKEECKDSNVPFNYELVILKLVIPQIPSTDRLVAHDGEYAYIQQNCHLVTRVDARKVNENYVVMVYPDQGIAELLSRNVPSREDLSCVVRRIDVTKNKIGFPLCYN